MEEVNIQSAALVVKLEDGTVRQVLIKNEDTIKNLLSTTRRHEGKISISTVELDIDFSFKHKPLFEYS